MNSRKVWAIKWELSNGTTEKRFNQTFLQVCYLYSHLWESGLRSMVIRRLGVNGERNS